MTLSAAFTAVAAARRGLPAALGMVHAPDNRRYQNDQTGTYKNCSQNKILLTETLILKF